MTPHPAAPVTDWMAIPGYRVPAEDLLGVSVPESDTEHARVAHTGVPRAFSLGWLGVLADTAGGRWLAHRLDPGMRCPTVTMHLELVRPHVAGRDSVLVAHGRPLSHGDGWALGEIVVMGAGPLPLAVGNTRFVLAGSDPSAPDPPQLAGVVTFHRPIPVGDPVSVTATVVHRGRTAALAEATVYAGNGKPLTTARGNFGRFRSDPASA